MVTSGMVADADATAEFNARCTALVDAWEDGTLPYTDAIEKLTALADEAQSAHHRGNQARAEHLLGYVQAHLGNLSTSIRHFERSRRLYEAVGNRRRIAAIDLNQGENYRYKGDFTRARYLYQMAYEAARETDFLTVQTIAIVNEGLVSLAVGRYDNARKALEEGLLLAEQWTEGLNNRPGLICEIHDALAQIHLHHEDSATAWQHACYALEAARDSGHPMQMAQAHRTLGEVISVLGGSPDPNFSSDPNAYFSEAVSILMDMNIEADLGKTLLAYGKALARMGKRTAAVRKMQQALLIFTRLGMTADAAAAAESQRAVIA